MFQADPFECEVEMTPQGSQSSDYLVFGRDAAGSGDELMRLAPEHWDYIDRFAPRLIARGPLLSPDGEAHTGSLHIITFSSVHDAQRFAEEEPYNRANLYSSVTVTRFRNLLGRTMWECAPAVLPAYSTFLYAHWPARSCARTHIERLRLACSTNTRWVFLGLLLSGQRDYVGMAAAADLNPEAAEKALRELFELGKLHADSIELDRWQRGGRPS